MITASDKIKSALFDLDGTLVNSIPGIEYALQEALRAAMPSNARPLDILAHIGPPIGVMIQQMLPELAPESAAEVEHQFRRIYDLTGWQKTEVYPGVADMLNWLNAHHIQCFVVTNKPRQPSRMILEKAGLLNYFQEIVTPESRQPAFRSKGEMAAYVIDKFGLKVNQALMVGDSTDDYLAARNLNLRFLAAAYGYGRVQSPDAFNTVDVIFRAVDIIDYVAQVNQKKRFFLNK